MKSARRPKARRTTMVPVTTMEELPVLNDSERSELLECLKQSEQQIATGHFTNYDPKEFKSRLMRIYRGKKR